MISLLHFMLNEEDHPIRSGNILFAVMMAFLVLVVSIVLAIGIGYMFFDINSSTTPAWIGYLLGGVFLMGFVNGIFSFTGLLILALRAPKKLGINTDD
jgi:hypothetical protein